MLHLTWTIIMKNLQFHYHMEIAFSEPVCRHIYTLKCLPKTTGTQQITECTFHILPNGKVQESTDSFGNRMLYGTAEEEHSLFRVDVTGRAVTGLCGGEEPEKDADISVYRYQTPLTRPDERILALLGRCRERTGACRQSSEAFRQQTEACQKPEKAFRQQSLHEKMCLYMEMVHESIAYDKGVTNVHTTAEESLALGRGVCQDYSHILLSLCREDRIPARYVVGMLMGEGESHAWVEVYDGVSWRGFDPTNNVAAEDSHIKISHGRDYRDCSINRGVFTGGARQRQSILVEVREEENNDHNSCTSGASGQ